MQRVFVLDKNEQPLMPCHPARARELLRHIFRVSAGRMGTCGMMRWRPLGNGLARLLGSGLGHCGDTF